MSVAGRASAAAASGALLAGAFEPVALPVLAPVAVAGLVATLTGRSAWAAAVIGGAFGVGFTAPLLWWLDSSIGPEAWVSLSLAQGCWFALTGVGLRAVARLPGWPWWAAGVWTSVEVLRGSWPFGGFPWGRVGHAVVGSPWEALLPYVGVSGTSYVLALVAATTVWAASRIGAWRCLAPAAALGLSLVPALAPFSASPSGSMRVAVVQGGVPGEGNDVVANAARVTRNHVEATQRLAEQVAAGDVPRPDLVVWPENSTASDPFVGDIGSGIATASQALVDVPLLVGAIVDAPRPENVLNQGIVWTATGPTAERYTKHHPVPFGEWIPFRSVLGGVSGRLDQVPRDMIAGSGSTPLKVAGVQAAVAICFDIAHDDVVGPQVLAGADLVVVQTSNATFTGTHQLDQQLAITRARALETGRTIVVASLNGISSVIAPDGEVLVRARHRSTEVFSADVELRDRLTPAVVLGDRFSLLVLLVTGAGVTTRVVTGGRSRLVGRRQRQPVAD